MTRQRIDDDFLCDGADGIGEDDLENVLNQADAIETKARKMLSFSTQVMLLLDMLRDYFTGNYSTIPYRIIGGIVFSLLYVLNPIDLVPDIFPGLGFLDDALLVALLLAWASSDIERYRAWREKNDDKTPVTAPKK